MAQGSRVASGLHGGLGLCIYTVFSIAGLLHTGQVLSLSRIVRIGATMPVFGACLRIAPEFDFTLPGPLHALPSLIWASGFLIWVVAYWPVLRSSAAIVKSTHPV